MSSAHIYLIKRLLLDLLYPNRCGLCGGSIPFNEFFCNTCIKLFSPAPKNVSVPYADLFSAYTIYDSFGKRLVLRLKNKSNGYALSGAAYLICKSITADFGEKLKKTDFITYIPMRKNDLRKRGYNQCRIIAKELSYLIDKPCRAVLVKTRDNLPQKYLTAAERRENVRDVFACSKPAGVKGKTILLIDDVSTTGSTISEAARVLKEAGAERVFVGVLAKTVIR